MHRSSRNFVVEIFQFKNFFVIQLLSGFPCINNLAKLAKYLENYETRLRNDLISIQVNIYALG